MLIKSLWRTSGFIDSSIDWKTLKSYHVLENKIAIAIVVIYE